MKIAFVSDAVYPYNKGGREKRLHEMSTRLAAAGHEVTIYCMKWWDGPEKSRVEDGVTLRSLCKLYPLYNGDKRSIKEGVMFGLACWNMLKYEYDVVDVDHMPFFPLFSMWMVCGLQERKMYGTWHEALTRTDWTSYMGPGGNIAAIIERITVHLPYAITAASAQTQRLIATELKRTKRIHMVPSGIDVARITAVKPADIDCDVLFVGRLVKDKNVALLVEAIAVAAQQKPDISCIIVGTGIEYDNIRSIIAQHQLEDTVKIAGNLPKATDVYGYMKAAKVFALPSNREGFGIVVLESLACNTPVVTINTAANASKDLITDGQNGSVVEPTPKALATAILEWLARPAADRAFADEVAGYDWDSLVKHQVETYTR